MATFKIEAFDGTTESVEAHFVVFEDGRYQFKTFDPKFGNNMNTFIIADKYVRSVSKV